MSDQDYVKSLIKEAELYRSQGLLAQSKEIYLKVLDFVRKKPQLSNEKKLIDAVGKKIEAIDRSLDSMDEEPDNPELSGDVQNLIRDLFSFSGNKDAAAIEGAMALAKFGQYERALTEFHALFKKGKMALVAAKNIIRCHLALSSPNEAIDQYEQWLSGDTLSKGQLESVRVFLEDVLERKGVNVKLPVVGESADQTTDGKEKDGEVLDISSVGVKMAEGPRKGKMVEFDVTFQSGNIISIVVSSVEKDLIECLRIGITLPEMQFYSPIAIFTGRGVVSGKTQIRSGPKEGDYMLDIKVESG